MKTAVAQNLPSGFSKIDNSFHAALARMKPPEVTPMHVFQQIGHDVPKLTEYVGARTGLSGDALAAEVVRFSKAMRGKNG